MGSGQRRIRLLGRFAVTRDGEEVSASGFGGRLTRRLIRYLVCAEGDLVPRDVLVEALWGQHPPADPDANLNVLVNRARRVLGADVLRTGAGGYRFDPATCVVDAAEFLGAVVEGRGLARRRAWPQAAATFARALALWGGEPLPEDLYEAWSEPPRRRLLDAHQEALEGAAEAALAYGDLAEAAAFARQAAEREPLREAAHLLLARALEGTGDRAAALETLRLFSERTREELGLDEPVEVRRLEAALLDDAGQRLQQSRATVRQPVAGAPPALPFIGRDDAMAQARDAVGATPPQPVVVFGAAGSGKSRFLDELARHESNPVAVRAHLAERDADHTFLRAVLGEVVGTAPRRREGLPAPTRAAVGSLLPDLDPGAIPPLDAPSLRFLLTEGTVALVAAASADRQLFVLDDLQWADASSLDILAVATSRLPGLRLAVAYRPGDVDRDGPAQRFLRGLERLAAPPRRIPLGPFDPHTFAAFATEPLRTVLVEHTGRSPFEVVEILTELAAAAVVRRRRDGRWETHPGTERSDLTASVDAGHRRASRTRIERESGPRRELLELVAMLGRDAPARLLAAAAARDRRAVLDELDALSRSGLVQPTERGWTIVHDLIAEVIVEAIPPARRSVLHANLAQALRDDAADPGELAGHLEGAGDAAQAAAAHSSAARRRLERGAFDEADRHATAGLELDVGGAAHTDLLSTRAQARAARGRLTSARKDLRRALRRATAGPERAHLLTQLALLSLGAENLHRADELAELALVESGDDPASRARSLSIAAVVDMNLRRTEQSRARAGEALTLFRRLGDARGVADILDVRGMAEFLDGDVTGAIDAFDRVAALFEDTGQLVRIVTPRSTRGHALVFADRAGEGYADTVAALELAATLGHVEGMAYARWHGSEALTALGRVDEAITAAERALAAAHQIQHRGWTATANLALGLGYAAAGELARACTAYEQALELSEHLPLFRGWAAARLARARIGQGRLSDGETLIELAGEVGPPLGQYETRLADVELRVARKSPGARDVLRQARNAAQRGGHLASARELVALEQHIT